MTRNNLNLLASSPISITLALPISPGQSDGRALVVSSTDGYCSIVTFAEGELGKEYKPSKDAQEPDGQTPSKSTAEKSVNKTVKDSDNSTLQTSNIKMNESHKDIQLASVDTKNESHETPTEIADASDTSKRKEGQTVGNENNGIIDHCAPKSPLKLNCTKEVKVDNKSLSPAEDQTDSKITEEIDTKPSVSTENKKIVKEYCCETSETVEKMEIDDKEACIISPQKASQTKTPTLKSVTVENESLSKSSSDPKATTKGIEQTEPLRKDKELLETAIVSETLDVISSPIKISEITQTLKSDCSDNEKTTSSNDDNLNNTVTDDKCRMSEFESPRTPSKLNSDSTELCDKKSTPSSPAQGQISSPCVTPNQEEACIISPQKASQTKTPTLKSVIAENESLSKSSSDPKATTKGIEQTEPLRNDKELLETAVVSETLDVISSPISEITQTLKSDCSDNEKTSSNDDNLNNTVTDDKCRVSEFEPLRTPIKLNSDSTELCDKKSTPSSPAQGQISSPCVTPNQEVHPTEIRTSISPSSVVWLNTTGKLANYATEAGSSHFGTGGNQGRRKLIILGRGGSDPHFSTALVATI
ncbi:unnamed protein product [Timema podura]|uniref:Uncharacterized protein n=1 Tax=Timema podura TaxID=61482 RepID=A0ABN7NVD9_TIMPD|nr:unnamed protein product [Timema podura]